MKLQEILETFDSDAVLKNQCGDPKLRLRQVCILTLDSRSFSEDTLYVTCWSEFRCMNVRKVPSVFVIVMDEKEELCEELLPEKYILLSCELNCHALYYSLMAKLKTSERVAEAQLILSRALLDGISASGLIEIAAHLLENPIIIQDFTTKLMLHSQIECREFNDEILEDLFANGYVSTALFVKYDYEHVLQQIEENRSTFLLRSDQKSERLICRLTINQKYFGWILTVAFNQPFQDGDVEIMDYLSQAISLLFERENILPASNHAEFLLRELMGNHSYSQEQFEKRALGFSWTLKKHYYVLVVRGNGNVQVSSQKRLMLSYKNYLSIMYPEMKSIYEDRELTLFFDRDSMDSIMGGLERFLVQHDLHAGMSDRFYDIMEFKERYEHARGAMEIGENLAPGMTVYRFSDYCQYFALKKLASATSISYFCSPELIRVYRYDKENGTDFAGSERVYLESRSMILAAQNLGIHRNTMVYRHSKFVEISGLDVSYFYVRERLIMSYRILDLYPELVDRDIPGAQIQTESLWGIKGW